MEEEMKTEQEKKKAGGAEGISLEHRNILLAEDNDLNAEIAIELLKMKGPACAGRRMENGLWNCLWRAVPERIMPFLWISRCLR